VNTTRTQARWNEPIIFELDTEGERGLLIEPCDPAIEARVGDGVSRIPPQMRRQVPPALPRVAQPAVAGHFLRLSQETLGVDLGRDVGVGTCTMKYSPRLADRVVRDRGMRDLHPLQDPETVQGVLAVMAGFEAMLCSISGMARFSFQAGGGTQAIYTNARMIRAYHDHRGSGRDEMITTVFSHPGNAAAARTAGFKVVTLYPDDTGLPSLASLQSAVSDRTAGLMLTNPEDTGLFNPAIDRFVELVHAVGGVCAYDQANANGLLGITRARDAGFDLCQFNLHKTFGSPHGASGLAVGAVGASEELEKFLPTPIVRAEEDRYVLDAARPKSVGKIRSFYGVVPTVVRAYAWVLSLGPDGLRQVAETAVLNNNYLAQRLSSIRGLSIPFGFEAGSRLEQVRYSWEQLAAETGLDTLDVARRLVDFGMASYFPSHHPWIVPEPMTLEPVESTSKSRLDEFVAAVAAVSDEAYSSADRVRTAPHASTIHQLSQDGLDEPGEWAPTWRAYVRKQRSHTDGDR
jgi:glycine dehydrogenase subunit 2